MSTDSSQQHSDQAGESHSPVLRDTILLFAKGVAMGLGDSVPGISGGTIAVITNTYDQLIHSIRAVDQLALSKIFQGNFGAAWHHINGNFLFILAMGMLSGLLLSANTVLYLLEKHFEILMGFFVGLVFAASFLLLPQVSPKRASQLAGLCLGVVLTVGIGLLEPLQGEPALWFLFLSGAIAISAMILPGLSGAFILLLLGTYEYMLTALIEFQIGSIGVFVAGCGCGLLVFSRLLAWLLKHCYQLSYSVIIGMLLGSLSVLWPWQEVLSVYVDSDGIEHPLQTGLVWPLNYTEVTGQDPRIFVVVLALILGAAVVYSLQRIFAGSK